MDLYESITNRIIAQLEAGTVPWRKPWKSSGGLPRNLISKKPYRGVNLLLLGMFNHENPFYLTYRQAQLFGGHVRQGEHGVPIVYWNISKKETTDEQGGVEEERFAFLKHYTVFHVSQCELPPELLPVMLKVDPPNRFFPAETCEQIVATMPQRPGIQTHAGGALYRPSVDTVFMPDTRLFTSTEGYYATLFHELGHATGHASRLNRQGLTTSAAFGSETYSKEELVAEMCSSFVCGHAGIDCAVLDNAAAYIASWLKILKGDRRLVVQAAQAAQKAADCILGTKFEPAAE